MSWYDSGMPVTNDPDVLCTAELIKRLYAMSGCDMGGPLHAMLDDGNIDDGQVESDYYDATDGRTTETYLCKHRMVRVGTAWRHAYDDVLHPPQGVADLSRLILASMRRMSEPWRAAAIAWADGTIARNLPTLVDTPGFACSASPEQVDDLIADLRRWIKQGETSGPKACVPIPCPPFTEIDLNVGCYEHLFADGPSVLLADVPPELRRVADQYIQDHAPVVTSLPGGRFEVSSGVHVGIDPSATGDTGLSIHTPPQLGDAPEGAPRFTSAHYTVHRDGSVETSTWTAEDVLRHITPPQTDVAAILDDPRQIRPVYPNESS